MSQIRQIFVDHEINGIHNKVEHRVLYTPQDFTELQFGDFFVDAMPLLVKTGVETAFIKNDNFWNEKATSNVTNKKGVSQNNGELRYNRYNASLMVYKVLKIDTKDGNIVYSAYKYYDRVDGIQDDNSYAPLPRNGKETL